MARKKKEMNAEEFTTESFANILFDTLNAWYGSLNEQERQEVAVFTLVADMKNGVNHTFSSKDESVLRAALIQEFHTIPTFKTMCKEAIDFVDDYEVQDLVKIRVQPSEIPS